MSYLWISILGTYANLDLINKGKGGGGGQVNLIPLQT